MNKKTELTAADLALYWGAPCLYCINGQEIQWSISAADIRDFTQGRCLIKPILRPLSDITQDEMREKAEIYRSACKKLGLFAHGVAADTRYMLSKHFDLFGWIDAGFAIDKTKTGL